MSRMKQLEFRRRVLIARCELQRAEMALRVGELKNDPLRRVLAGALGGTGAARGGTPLRHPLTWVVALAGLFLLRRPRQILTVLGWARSAVSLAAKASVAMRVFGQVRSTLSRGPRGDERA
jgi:hypothetical protein